MHIKIFESNVEFSRRFRENPPLTFRLDCYLLISAIRKIADVTSLNGQLVDVVSDSLLATALPAKLSCSIY